MKGKIALISITKPVDGMRVVYNKIFYDLYLDFDDAGHNRIIDLNGGIDLAPDDLSELKQIVIEIYSTSTNKASDYFPIQTLPISPANWEYAIQHIGEEVEFNQFRSMSHGNGMGIGEYAQLILPSPILYTEEEVLKLLLLYTYRVQEKAFGDGKLEKWWNKNKKKQ